MHTTPLLSEIASRYLFHACDARSPLLLLRRSRLDVSFLCSLSCLFFFSNDTAPTYFYSLSLHYSLFFFLNDPASPEISPFPLHAPLPIYGAGVLRAPPALPRVSTSQPGAHLPAVRRGGDLPLPRPP